MMNAVATAENRPVYSPDEHMFLDTSYGTHEEQECQILLYDLSGIHRQTLWPSCGSTCKIQPDDPLEWAVLPGPGCNKISVNNFLVWCKSDLPIHIF